MSASAICLIGLIGWTLVLTFVLLGARGKEIMAGHPLAPFDQDGNDVQGFAQRATRNAQRAPTAIASNGW